MALDLERIQVDSLMLRDMHLQAGGLQLGYARIGVLVVDDHLPADAALPGPLSALGWTVQDVDGVIRHDRKAAATWLRTAPAEHSAATQPWHELAAVYDRNGQPADARRLRAQAAWRSTRTAPLGSKIVRTVYGLLVGHGYYPLLAAVWLALALTATGILTATHLAAFSPTMPTAATPTSPPTSSSAAPAAPAITGATPCHQRHIPAQVAATYPCLNPALYALDAGLPTATGGTASAWRPTTNGWLPLTLTLLRTFTWITTALLLAGVTGLLRKT